MSKVLTVCQGKKLKCLKFEVETNKIPNIKLLKGTVSAIEFENSNAAKVLNYGLPTNC